MRYLIASSARFLLICSIASMLTVIAFLASYQQTGTVHAASGSARFTMRPATPDPNNPVTRSYFVLHSQPDATMNESVVVTNAGEVSGTADIYSVDATTSQTSGVSYLGKTDPKQEVGSWISLSTNQVTLAPGQSQTLAFTIKVPSNAHAGPHVGGLAVETSVANSNVKTNNFQVHIQSRTVIAVEIVLPGATTDQMEVNGVAPGGANNYQTLDVSMTNTGTTMLHPQGQLQITDAQNKTVQTLPIKMGTFLPGTSIKFPTYITGKALGVGDYNAIVDMTYGQKGTLHYTTKFSVTSQNVAQVFNQPLQAPVFSGDISTFSTWQLAMGGAVILLVAATVLFWTQKLFKLAGARRKTNDDDE